MRKAIRMKYIIVGILLAAIAGIVIFLAAHAKSNKKQMAKTISESMQILAEHFQVTERDPAEYAQIRIYGLMKFNVKQYEIGGVGNLSVMTTNMGFMQMLSFVITPFEKNLPLLSMDFMYFPGSRKTYTEVYDLVADKDAPEYQTVLETMNGLSETGKALADLPRGELPWYDHLLTVKLYKTGSAKQDETIHALFCDAVSRYADAADTLEPLSEEEKAVKAQLTQQYSDDLIEKGGVSTDVFKKALGPEKTKDFFDKVFFGNSAQ
ncbi:MAG: hypothetical protein IK134_04045 [Oscillospiraceae bacterium]|nr:hypothetical protein [Oscillospiraceae bacterium]